MVVRGLNVADSEGRTSLHIAVLWDDDIFADVLLKLVANVNALSEQHDTPLQFACYRFKESRKQSLLDLLVRKGADLSLKNKEGYI